MKSTIRHLDRILRGDATAISALRTGTLDIPVASLSVLLLLLAALYGCCMGWYGLFNRQGGPDFQQMFASMVKVPMLYFLTLLVTFPSLYVFNALVGSRLTLKALGRLLVAAMAVTLAVLASFGPIVAFFSVTTTSHPFVLLLNVAFCAVAGSLGMFFLLQTLHRLSVAMGEVLAPGGGIAPTGSLPPRPAPQGEIPVSSASAESSPPGAEPLGGPRNLQSPAHIRPAGDDLPILPPLEEGALKSQPPASAPGEYDLGALDRLKGQVLGAHVKTVFRCWVVLFALVGTQMSWVLRPFIGGPDEAFHWFEARESNFFVAVWETIRHLL